MFVRFSDSKFSWILIYSRIFSSYRTSCRTFQIIFLRKIKYYRGFSYSTTVIIELYTATVTLKFH